MRAYRLPPVLALLFLLLGPPACKRDVEAETAAEREQNATKVTADSTDDATAPTEPFIAPSSPAFSSRWAPPPSSSARTGSQS